MVALGLALDAEDAAVERDLDVVRLDAWSGDDHLRAAGWAWIQVAAFSERTGGGMSRQGTLSRVRAGRVKTQD